MRERGALRARYPAEHVEFLRCGPRSAVLESEHEAYHAQLPDSRLSEWRAAPTSRALRVADHAVDAFDTRSCECRHQKVRSRVAHPWFTW
jgi:hypothetical protein